MKTLGYILLLAVSSFASLECGAGEFKYNGTRRRRSIHPSCKECPSGRHKMLSVHTDQYCDLCESGRWQDLKGQSDCKGSFKCQPGKYGNVGSISVNDINCKECDAGYYSPSNGMESCGACPSGRFTDSLAQSTCKGDKICPAGKWLEGGVTSQQHCKECAVNKYTDVGGSFSCKNCPKGKYGEKNGAEDCISEPSCDRWYLVDKVTHKCFKIYDMTLYKMLVGLYWSNAIIGMFAMCGDYNNKTVMCMHPYMFLIYFILFGVTVWLTTPSPGNLSNGMTDTVYYICLTIVCISLIVNIGVILTGYVKKSTTSPV